MLKDIQDSISAEMEEISSGGVLYILAGLTGHRLP